MWPNDGEGAFAHRACFGIFSGGSRCAALFDADGDGDVDALRGGGRSNDFFRAHDVDTGGIDGDRALILRGRGWA